MEIYKNLSENNIDSLTLDNLPEGKGGYISSINICGRFRRRLLDLGFTEGAFITCLYTAPLGDPSAYSILGSTIALRKSSASLINISTASQNDAEVARI